MKLCSSDNHYTTAPLYVHILTGDLRIIKSNKLRKLICKGPKYYESKAVDFNTPKNNIFKGIDKCIRSWKHKKGLPKALLSQWKSKISECIEEKIVKLRSSDICPGKSQTIKYHGSVKDALNDRYLITSIDKAKGTVALICKKIKYLLCLKNLK